jgi:hypothetical protein
VTFLGRNVPLKWRSEGGKLYIEAPPITSAEFDLPQAYVFKLTGVE